MEGDTSTGVSMTTETGSEAEVGTGAPDTIATGAGRGTEKGIGSTGDEVVPLRRGWGWWGSTLMRLGLPVFISTFCLCSKLGPFVSV